MWQGIIEQLSTNPRETDNLHGVIHRLLFSTGSIFQYTRALSQQAYHAYIFFNHDWGGSKRMSITSPQEKRLEQLKIIYLLYGFVDGVNLSYSVLKYFFDMLATEAKKNSNILMHHWLSSSEGIAGFFMTGVVVVLSIFGNTTKDNDENILKRYIAQFWPYVRDFIKSAKNAYKGVRSVFSMMKQLGFFNYTNIFLLGAAGIIGGISIATRLGLRAFRNDRKSKQSKNQFLAERLSLGAAYGWEIYPNGLPTELSSIPFYSYLLVLNSKKQEWELYYRAKDEVSQVSLPDNVGGSTRLLAEAVEEQDPREKQKKIHDILKMLPDQTERFTWAQETLETYRSKVKNQTINQRAYGYIASAIAGFIDGMYLYMGVYAITMVVPPAFIVICVFSSLYLLTSIVTRLYEEHEYQVRLSVSAVRVNLLSYYEDRKTLARSLLSDCDALLQQKIIPVKDIEEKLDLYRKAQENYTKFYEKDVYLRRLGTISAVLFGLKNGITVYGVVAAGLFAIATFLTLAAVPFPPVLLIAGISLGLVCLVGFVAYAVHDNKKKRKIVDDSAAEYRTVTPSIDDVNQLLTVYDTIYNSSNEERKSQLIDRMRDTATRRKERKNSRQSLEKKSSELNPLTTIQDTVREEQTNQNLLKDLPDSMHMDLDPSTGLRLTGEKESRLRDVSEVLRSIFSGCTKGFKWVVLLFNALLHLDKSGNNQESIATLVIGSVATALNVFVLGARAWAKGFGLDWVKSAPEPVELGVNQSVKWGRDPTVMSLPEIERLFNKGPSVNLPVDLVPNKSQDSGTSPSPTGSLRSLHQTDVAESEILQKTQKGSTGIILSKFENAPGDSAISCSPFAAEINGKGTVREGINSDIINSDVERRRPTFFTQSSVASRGFSPVPAEKILFFPDLLTESKC